jgi:hypothetical protein
MVGYYIINNARMHARTQRQQTFKTGQNAMAGWLAEDEWIEIAVKTGSLTLAATFLEGKNSFA